MNDNARHLLRKATSRCFPWLAATMMNVALQTISVTYDQHVSIHKVHTCVSAKRAGPEMVDIAQQKLVNTISWALPLQLLLVRWCFVIVVFMIVSRQNGNSACSEWGFSILDLLGVRLLHKKLHCDLNIPQCVRHQIPLVHYWRSSPAVAPYPVLSPSNHLRFVRGKS